MQALPAALVVGSPILEMSSGPRAFVAVLQSATTGKRHERIAVERDAALRARLQELAAKRMRFGYRRLTAMLVREGVEVNHKRVYRLYREEGLAMRIRQRRRIRWNLLFLS
jgi:putative transposase